MNKRQTRYVNMAWKRRKARESQEDGESIWTNLLVAAIIVFAAVGFALSIYAVASGISDLVTEHQEEVDARNAAMDSYMIQFVPDQESEAPDATTGWVPYWSMDQQGNPQLNVSDSTTMYISSALAETQNPSQEEIGGYIYTPGEAVQVLSVEDGVAKVLFGDGHTDFMNLDWLDPEPYGSLGK